VISVNTADLWKSWLRVFVMRPYEIVTRDGEDEADGDAAATANARAAMVWTREAGKAIIRVVGRVDDAKESENLGN